MHAQQVSQDDIHIAEALETIELELALQVQDVAGIGFEAAINAALTSLGGQILFRLPATSQPDAREIAAVSVPSGQTGTRKLLLVSLARDGENLRIDDAGSGNNPIANLAQSMAGVLDTFSASRARESEPIAL